jgi:putative addiction module killer protein
VVVQAMIKARIDRVIRGVLGDCKTLKGCSGLYELRISQGSGYRIYFGKQGMSIIILLCAGDKRTQKKDIEKAISYWKTLKESL